MRVSGARFIERVLVEIRYWLFPAVVLVGWMLAASYTLYVASRASAPEVKAIVARPLQVAAARPPPVQSALGG
jgi:hypothetical protein